MTGTRSRLERDSFEHYDAPAGSKALLATFEAPNPMVLRADRPLRIAIPAFETFDTAGEAEPQTFELGHDLVESPQSKDLLLFADGERISPESVDYDADSFEFDDGEEETELAVYYISGDDCELEIERQAPSSHGAVHERVFEEPLALMHQRDQDEQPRTFDVGDSEFQRVIPTDWKLNIYVDAEYPVVLEDEATGTRARNAILSLPYVQAQEDVDGLSRAVAHDIVNRA
ncbi:hypothetical protein OB905_11780 [Halobacteria archaeon AArc-dxtr1]|nr:hypothetical protein [Halobacteria archaeon AArc-dxtr1]